MKPCLLLPDKSPKKHRMDKFKMVANEDIRDIFSILHDGGIAAWSGNKSILTLTVECAYLAERIDKSFDRFYVELFNIDKLAFEPWTNQAEIPGAVITDLANIFNADLEILSADIKEDVVVVTCYQHDPNLDYGGGVLIISSEAIKVFDQNKNELTIEQFDAICNEYWDELSKENAKEF